MRVQNTSGAQSAGIKIVVAGEAGNGKTTLARTLQETLGERVLLVSAEAGLLSLRGSGVDFVDLQTDDEGKPVPKELRVLRLGAIYQWLLLPEQMAKYKWIFLDSLTEVNQNLLEALLADPNFNSPKDTIKMYGELAKRMRSLCKTFRDMPYYNIVFSALVKKTTDADNVVKSAIDITGSFALQLPALFDEVFYLGVTNEVDEATGRNKRTVLTQKTDRIEFPKDRSGRLSRYEEADLGAMVRKMRGESEPAPPATTTASLSPSPTATPAAASGAGTGPSTPTAPLVTDASAEAKAAAKKSRARATETTTAPAAPATPAARDTAHTVNPFAPEAAS